MELYKTKYKNSNNKSTTCNTIFGNVLKNLTDFTAKNMSKTFNSGDNPINEVNNNKSCISPNKKARNTKYIGLTYKTDINNTIKTKSGFALKTPI